MPLEHCEHVYRDVRKNPCPICGGDSHITDFELIHKQHKEWIASGKAIAQGWWSI